MSTNSIGLAEPKFTPEITAEEAEIQARLLRALADPTRLRILSLLGRHEGEICVRDMVECFSLEQPTISHHLRFLREVGLVDSHNYGNWFYYYLRRDVLIQARRYIASLG